MNVADLISKELKKYVKDIFMLTGYGAMYLNNSIQKEGINIIAARNEAAAPMMAEAYAKAKNGIGAVCVTAGPGATNAIPGLAEAFVDSSPIIVISGQVEKKFISSTYKNYNIRSFGLAEFSISEAIKKLTKYSKLVLNPYECLYELNKAIDIATSGRPGPVWLEFPLDIQAYEIKRINKLKKYLPKKNINKKINISSFYKSLNQSKKPIFLTGNGIKQSNSQKLFLKLVKKLKVPFMQSRFAIDICPYSNSNNLGQIGIKGQPFNKEIIQDSDLIISFGCRFAPALTFGEPKNFAINAKKILIDIDAQSFNHPLLKIDQFYNTDVKYFIKKIFKNIKKYQSHKYEKQNWLKYCQNIKNNKKINLVTNKSNPIDLYYFMYQVNKLSKKNSIFTNDAGSNYYVGGQVWYFEKKQIEIASTTNASMGLSIPLSIGAAIAKPKLQIISITGDGSIELNIQELKTISHYNLNIKTFVINNGGYASMNNWHDKFFSGNRLDTSEKTGVGTLNFRNIAKAFDIQYYLIKNSEKLETDIKEIFSNNRPYLVEVVTRKDQTILGIEI